MNYNTDQAGGSYRWWALAAVALANLSAVLDMSIVVVSYPRLTEVFHTSPSVVVWLVMAFSIAQLGLLLTFAKIGDTLGRKKVFLFGVALYTLGLILCSISPNIIVLIASRAVQGAGAAISMTVGSAIVVAVFPQNQQGRAIGLIAMLTSVGLVAGPALGGVVIQYLDWRGIFYTRIPVVFVSLILAALVIKEPKQPRARLKLDYGGALTLLGAMSCLLLYFNLGGNWGYFSMGALGLLAAMVIFLAAFIYVEKRAAQPVLELGLFKNRVFTMANITLYVQMAPSSMCPNLIPFLLMNGLLYSSFKVGILMALIAIPPVIISPISGWISDKIGTRAPTIFGVACFPVALFFASRLNIESGTIQIALVLLLFGVGMGIFTPPNQSAAVGAAPRSSLSTTLGVSNAVKVLGGSTGTAIAGTLYARQQSVKLNELAAQGVSGDMLDRLSAVKSFQQVIFIAAIISIVAIVTAIFTGRLKKSGN
jgi:EmrB/QacA subfamily drug resistance transporter